MIRWKFVLPRLTILCALLLLLTLGSGPAIKWTLVQSGQQVTGAKVDIGGLKTRWLQARLDVESIEIADPNSPSKNALVAESAILDLDLSQLLRKRMVVEKAILTGIAFDQPRTSSGVLPETSPQDEGPNTTSPWLSSAKELASDQLQNWVQQLADLGIDELENQLETVQVAKELSQRWPLEYDEMSDRVARLEDKFARLKSLADEPNTNPLRMAQLVSAASQDVKASITEIDDLYREVQRLRDQIPLDKQRLMDAKRRDQETIKQFVKAPKLNPDDVTRSLFGEEQGEQIQETLSWIQWIRNVVPNPNKDFQPSRSRGVDVRFGDNTLHPALWIRESEVNGVAPLGANSNALEFSGRIANLSTHPRRIDRPVTVDLVTRGDESIEIHAILDRTQEVAVDQISVEIPNRPQKQIRFGTEETLVVNIPESQSHLKLELTLIDREIRGVLRIEQRNAKMTVDHVDDKLGGTYVHSLMGASLESIDTWDLELVIGGTLDDPELELRSSLGPALAQELQSVVNRAVDDQRQRAEDYLDRKIDEQLTEIDGVFTNIESLQAVVQQVDREISGIKQTVTRLLGNRTLR